MGQHPVFAAHDQQAIADMARCWFGDTRGLQHGVNNTSNQGSASLDDAAEQIPGYCPVCPTGVLPE